MGPLMLYPSATFSERGDIARDPSASYAGPKADDPDRPAAIVLSLQSTLPGCEWMIGEWARLKAVLDEGQAWVPSDKLKATRLLGKQPFDVIDERDVALVYMASFVLKPDRESWWWEIAMELSKKDTMRFRKCAAVRELDSLQPENASKAREVLLGIIERATARVTVKADAHRDRAQAMAALVPDILAFDDSKEGEYLRRQELATGRGIARSLDTLYKHRRAPAGSNEDEGPDCVTNEPAVSENAMSEPYDVGENVTSEPNDVARLELGVSLETPNPIDSLSRGETSVRKEKSFRGAKGDNGDAAGVDPATFDCDVHLNHANDVGESTTSEPNDVGESVTSEPNSLWENATSEPNSLWENVTSEPNSLWENATSEPNSLGKT